MPEKSEKTMRIREFHSRSIGVPAIYISLMVSKCWGLITVHLTHNRPKPAPLTPLNEVKFRVYNNIEIDT